MRKVGLSGRGGRIIEFLDDELFILLYQIDRFLVVIVGNLQASLGNVGFFSGINAFFFFRAQRTNFFNGLAKVIFEGFLSDEKADVAVLLVEVSEVFERVNSLPSTHEHPLPGTAPLPSLISALR
jgi:hypothetical protein